MQRNFSKPYYNSHSPTARYYNSDLSIWISVDPLSDKYPNLSPYTYCADNPVRLVDPNGKDIYEFDNYGNYIQCIPFEYDMIRIINGYTREISQSSFYEKGTIFQLEVNVEVNTSNPELQFANIFQVNSIDAAVDIFEFVADNTSVEWAMVQDAGRDGICTYFIGTNRNEKSHTINSMISNRGYSLDGRCVHNHPNGEQLPSEADIKNAQKLEMIHYSIQLETYTSPKKYLPYHGGSSYIDSKGQPQQGKDVKFKHY